MPNTVQHAKLPPIVVGGIDTHGDTHTVAAVDLLGRRLGCAQFPADRAGYQQLTRWLADRGRVQAVGVEGTGSYGAGLARFLTAAQLRVVEVNRPDRAARRRRGKSDPVDAEQAAVAVLNGTATAAPKTRTGPVEAIRMVHTTRAGAVKARTAAVNSFLNLLRTSPDEIRDPLLRLTRTRQLRTARSWRTRGATDPHHAAKQCLRRLADRIGHLAEEIAAADRDLRALTGAVAPQLIARPGIGPETCAQLLITVGDNPDRIGSQAAFAALCGTSPVQASSGKTVRHRLNRGGDRQANRALHIIILSRLRCHPATKDYIAARGGETTPHLMRCLKRSLAREIYRRITAPPDPAIARGQSGADGSIVAHQHRPEPGSRLAEGHPKGFGLDPGEDGAIITGRTTGHPYPPVAQTST